MENKGMIESGRKEEIFVFTHVFSVRVLKSKKKERELLVCPYYIKNNFIYNTPNTFY